MPDPTPALRFVADLRIEVGDERGHTEASLTGDGFGDLVLDVADPAVLLRCLPAGSRLPRVGAGALWQDQAREQLVGQPLVLASRGHVVARATLTSNGFRVRPGWSAVPVIARAVVQVRPQHLLRRRPGHPASRIGPRTRTVTRELADAAVAAAVGVLLGRRSRGSAAGPFTTD